MPPDFALKHPHDGDSIPSTTFVAFGSPPASGRAVTGRMVRSGSQDVYGTPVPTQDPKKLWGLEFTVPPSQAAGDYQLLIADDQGTPLGSASNLSVAFAGIRPLDEGGSITYPIPPGDNPVPTTFYASGTSSLSLLTASLANGANFFIGLSVQQPTDANNHTWIFQFSDVAVGDYTLTVSDSSISPESDVEVR